MRPTQLLLVVIVLLVCVPDVAATTWYVRTDGGTATQCTGQTDAAYSEGSGEHQACAWKHPFYALPPGGPAAISGGDTLIIADGSYMMGYGAPGAGYCDSSWPEECHMFPIPSGSSSTPTRILGAGWNSGCSTKPQLWGTERSNFVVDLTSSSNVEMQCIEITDHSNCVESHSGSLPCSTSSYPYGTWAVHGIYAQDSSSVLLKNLNVHGMASRGMLSGRLTNWTLDTVRIAANGWAGWDGDIDPSNSSDSGTMTFKKVTIEWNGCGETYPGLAPTGCWGQTAGGYGDGFGAAATVGHWIFEDSTFQYNTSDGLDLLYAQPGSTVEIRRCLSRGNAGNSFKTAGPTIIENSIAIANCAYHQGKSFTYDFTYVDEHGVSQTQGSVDPCRAFGNSVELDLFPGDTATVTNSTITGEGDVLVDSTCAEHQTCTGAEKVTLRNNIFVGNAEYLSPGDTSAMLYSERYPGNPFDADYSLAYGVKAGTCPGATHDLCDTAPGVLDATLSSFDAHLTSTSLAINAGTSTGAPTTDFAGTARVAAPDIGAYEYTSSSQGPAPANLVATGSGATQVDLTWTGSSGATSYKVERKSGGTDFAELSTGTITSTSYSDTSVSASNAYAYRVRAAFSGGTFSSYSNTDLATTFSFASVSTGSTIMATHITQLHSAIAAARTTAGLTTYNFTDSSLASGTTIKRLHVIELRQALNEVRTQLLMSTLTYTDSSIVANTTSVRAVHFTDLQQGVR
jgi:hypothetical protein